MTERERDDPIAVVWDFDRSFIPEDSDRCVLRAASPPELRQEIIRQCRERDGIGWNELMRTLLTKLHDAGVSQRTLTSRIASLEMWREVPSLVRDLHERGVEQYILSDSNTVYIETVLDCNGLLRYFSDVVTNPAHFTEEGRLHVGCVCSQYVTGAMMCLLALHPSLQGRCDWVVIWAGHGSRRRDPTDATVVACICAKDSK